MQGGIFLRKSLLWSLNAGRRRNHVREGDKAAGPGLFYEVKKAGPVYRQDVQHCGANARPS